MNKYKKFVHISKDFVPAIKVEHHLYDIEKLMSYIPTEKSIDIIRNFCINENGSNVIIGSYGSGKSHLTTLLANIMSGQYKSDEYKKLSNRIRNIDEETADLFDKRIKKRNKRFVIIPPYNSENFEQAILLGISKALKREGYEDVVIESSFSKVIKEIENWEKNFPQTLDEFNHIIEYEYFTKKEKFIKEIESFNDEYYQIFLEIYPKVTSGAQFFHYDNQNIVEILKQINIEMIKNGYIGLDIIFDEFGSFLENNIDRVNITLVQEIAELANDNKNRISFYIVTHKDLTQYGSRISDGIVTEWRKVEGRFRRFTLYQSSSDIYEIISNVLIKEETFNSFYIDHKDKFTNMYENILALPTFKELSEEEILKYIVKGCFPLSPLAAFSLHKLTDKVAQSNRTLFTFLISDDENSLGYFIINQKENFWVSGDLIYDYFEQSIWGENKNSSIYKVWKETSDAINKADSIEINIKLIKVIGLIYIIDDFDRLKPNLEYISLLLPQYTNKEIELALDELLKKKIILYRKTYDSYKFYEGSDLDVQDYMSNIIEDNKGNICIVDILNQYFLPLPIISRRHNDKYYVNRYLESRFVKMENLEPKKVYKELEDKFKDGLVYYVVPNNEKEIKNIIKTRNNFNEIPNLIILLPRKKITIEEIAMKYWAIINMLEDEELLNSQQFLKNELLLYEEELSRQIYLILSRYFNNEFKNVYVINKGEVLSEVNNRYILQKKASDIMDEYFKNTAIINNEMVNKNRLTPTMKSVARKVINKLWDSIANNKEFKFRKFSAEDTLVRTVYINSDILTLDKNNIVKLNYKNLPDNNSIKLIFNEMEEFLDDCRKEEQNFYNLYKKLKRRPYGIKDGLIPLLFAIGIVDNLDNIYIKRKGVYEDLDGKLLVKIIEEPNNYLISIDVWDTEKEDYILSLENLFKDYIDYEYRNKNRLGSLYEGIKKYYRGLPKFARETSLVSEETQKIRNIMSNEYLDYKELFFVILPGKFSYNLVVDKVKIAKDELDKFLDNLKEDFSKKIASIFGDEREGIKNSIENWFSNLDPDVKDYMFDLRTNLFIKYIQSPEEEYLRGLVKMLTGFDLEYISDEIVYELIDGLVIIKNKMDNFNGFENNLHDSIKIDISFDDKKKTKYLHGVELSDIGKLLETKIYKDINNFNYSINEEEKAYILIKILKEII